MYFSIGFVIRDEVEVLDGGYVIWQSALRDFDVNVMIMMKLIIWEIAF